MSLDDNLWPTGGFHVNLYSGEGGLLSYPMFLLGGNTILPMTPKADCELQSHYIIIGVFKCLYKLPVQSNVAAQFGLVEQMDAKIGMQM